MSPVQSRAIKGKDRLYFKMGGHLKRGEGRGGGGRFILRIYLLRTLIYSIKAWGGLFFASIY